MERLEHNSMQQTRAGAGGHHHPFHGHPFHPSGGYDDDEDYYDEDDEDYYDDDEDYYDEDDEGARFYDFFDFLFSRGGSGPFSGFMHGFPRGGGGFPGGIGGGGYDYGEARREKEFEAKVKANQDAISTIVKDREALLALNPSLGLRSSTTTSLELFVLVGGKPLVLVCKPSIEGKEPIDRKLIEGALFDVQVYREGQGHMGDYGGKGGGSSKKKKGKGKDSSKGGSGSGWVSLPSLKDPTRVRIPNLNPGTEYRVRVRLGISAECSILSELEWNAFGDESLVATKAEEPSAQPPPSPQCTQQEKQSTPAPRTPPVQPQPPPPPQADEGDGWLEDLGGTYKCSLCGTVLKNWDQVEMHELTTKHQKRAITAGIKSTNLNFAENR